MPNRGTGTLTEFGIALDVGERYWQFGGEKTKLVGGGLDFKDTFTASRNLRAQHNIRPSRDSKKKK